MRSSSSGTCRAVVAEHHGERGGAALHGLHLEHGGGAYGPCFWPSAAGARRGGGARRRLRAVPAAAGRRRLLPRWLRLVRCAHGSSQSTGAGRPGGSEPEASGHGVERERRPVGGRPACSRTSCRATGPAAPGRRPAGRPCVNCSPSWLSPRKRGDLLRGLGGPVDRLHMAAQHAVLLGGHRLDGEVDGRVRRGSWRALSAGTYSVAYSGSSAWATFSTAATFAPVVMICADRGGQRGEPARGDACGRRWSPRGGTDLQHGGVGGQPLALLGEHGGDLARDGALQDVTALRRA